MVRFLALPFEFTICFQNIIVSNSGIQSGVWNWENDVQGPKSPIWTMPIYIMISLIFATLLSIYFEEPCRKKLKEWKSKKVNTKTNFVSIIHHG